MINNNEILFWLVFHNKFLLNKIINYIQTIEWIIYDDHKQLHINNRLKFKDIHSLEWMIKNKQYQLLNNKLDNNDFIKIEKESITKLFNELSINNIIKNNNNNNSDSDNNTTILKEILIKFLIKKRDQFEIIDLTLEAVKCNSIEVLKILIDEKFSIILNPSTLNYAIQHSHSTIVQEILAKQPLKLLEKESLELALKNVEYKYEMIEFILFANNLEKESSKSFKSLLQLSPTSSSSSSLSPVLILINLFEKNSNNLFFDNKLFLNILILCIPKMLGLKNFNFINLSLEDIIKIYQFLQRDQITTTNIKDSNLSLKEIQEKIIIFLFKNNFKEIYIKFYKSYIIEYRETIDQVHTNETIIINCKDDQDYLKFKQFYRVANIFGMNILDGETDDPFVQWNQILFDMVVVAENVIIYDRSIVEWMLNCENEKILSFIFSYFYKLSFDTLELADYVYKESDLLNHLSPNAYDYNSEERHIYTNIWSKAMEQSDFDTIYKIESLGIGFFLEVQLSTTQIIKMVDNYKENGVKSNDFTRFCSFLDQISNVYGKCDADFSDLQLNLQLDNQDVTYVLFRAMFDMELKKVEILLNSSIFSNYYKQNKNDRFQIDNETIESYYLNQRDIFDRKGIVSHYKEKEGATRIEILEIIEKILLKFNQIKINDDDEDDGQVDLFSVMVNYFFEKFIQIKGITMNEVSRIYQLIQDNSIKVKHDLYHLFYYLHIKDIKYTFYLLSPQFIEILFINRDMTDLYDCASYHEPGNDEYLNDGEDFIYLEDYLNHSKLSLKEINDLPFDTVFDILVYQLSPLIKNNTFGKQHLQALNNKLNRDLEYFLIIKRFDLFFKNLENIKLKLVIENSGNTTSNATKPKIILLPNNTLFSDVDDSGDNNLIKFQPFELFIKTFKFSEKVINCICTSLDIDGIKKVIQFNYYPTLFLNQLLHTSIDKYRFDISKLINDNFNIIFTIKIKN